MVWKLLSILTAQIGALAAGLMTKNGHHLIKMLRASCFAACMICFSAFGVQATVYGIHYASYETQAAAKKEVEQMTKKGHRAFSQTADLGAKGVWQRVFLGPYDSSREAKSAATRFKQDRLIDEYYIRKLNLVKTHGGKTSVSDAKTTKKTSTQAAPTQSGPEKKIIGNSTSKRYHLPGMPYYSKVRAYHRVYFNTEEEAIRKGYYKAGTGPDEQKEKKENAAIKMTRKPPEKSDSLAKLKAVVPVETLPVKTSSKTVKTDLPAISDPIKLIDENRMDKLEFKDPDDLIFPEPISDSELYNKALAEMNEKKYEQALVTFKEFISREDTPKEWGQRALRHMADCHYHLGKAGQRQNLLIAAEFYKNTLESFPDPRPENALTYFRLAKTYEALKYYPESIRQYRNLITKYPDSAFDAEAYFKIGQLQYQDGKYGDAADQLIRYLMKYRGAARAKQSFYLIAHAFYKDKQSTNAEIWFRDAAKKWPSYIDVPGDILLDLGRHKISLRRFGEAVNALSFHVNIYPDDPENPKALLLLAQAFRLNDQYAAALAVYDLVFRKYPKTDEALTSLLSIAELGVQKPGLKVFASLKHYPYYKDPIDAFDTIIMTHPKGEWAEEAMLKKAWALVQTGQKRRGADVYLEYLHLHPESKRVGEAAKGLKSASASLVDDYFSKKDYLAVAYIYFKTFGVVAFQQDEYDQVEKMAKSLKELGFISDYQSLLNTYLNVVKDEGLADKIRLQMAEGFIAGGRYDQAQSILDELSASPSIRNDPEAYAAFRSAAAEISFKKGRFDQAVTDYGAALAADRNLDQPAKLYANYARALREQEKSDQALQTFLQALQYQNGGQKPGVETGLLFKEIGDLYMQTSHVRRGIDMYSKSLTVTDNQELKFWSQFMMGKAYMNLGQSQEAQTIFNTMKTASGADGFWGSVVDYYVADRAWWDKYGPMIK